MADASSLRIATAPVNWNNSDLPEWREHVPFPQILDEMIRAGYRESEYDTSLGSDLEEISKEMTKRSMSFCGAYFWIDTQDTAAFERDLASVSTRCRLLQRIGCHHLVVSDVLRPLRVVAASSVPPDGSLALDVEGYSTMADRLRQVAAVGAVHDIAVHYHNHAGTLIETPKELDALVDALGGTGIDLCFDTGHYVFGGGDAAAFVDDHADRIGYVHLKDVDPEVLATGRTLHWGLLNALRHIVFPPLGTGSADIRRIVQSLVANRFSGYVVIEQDTCKGDPTETARANREFVVAVSGSMEQQGTRREDAP